MNIAIIPARGGSKRIPRKNIKPFCGKPMVVWPIETALASGCFDQVLVSTDDSEIADIALQAGATVPFLRPAALADDYTGTEAVVVHALQTLQQQGNSPQRACCIYPTAPLLQIADLQAGLALLQQNDLAFALSVTHFPYPVQRALGRGPSGGLSMLYPEYANARSQDLPETFHDAGQFYWGTREAWLQGVDIFGARSAPVLLPRYRVQDIDTPEDWISAEFLFTQMTQQGHDR
jgi:pseudaminic acid cytidylyltransferase